MNDPTQNAWWIAAADGVPKADADRNDPGATWCGVFPAAVVQQAADMTAEVLKVKPTEQELVELFVRGTIPTTWGEHSGGLYRELWTSLSTLTRTTVQDMYKTQFGRPARESELVAMVRFAIRKLRQEGRLRSDERTPCDSKSRVEQWINPPRPGRHRRHRRPR